MSSKEQDIDRYLIQDSVTQSFRGTQWSTFEQFMYIMIQDYKGADFMESPK